MRRRGAGKSKKRKRIRTGTRNLRLLEDVGKWAKAIGPSGGKWTRLKTGIVKKQITLLIAWERKAASIPRT